MVDSIDSQGRKSQTALALNLGIIRLAAARSDGLLKYLQGGKLDGVHALTQKADQTLQDAFRHELRNNDVKFTPKSELPLPISNLSSANFIGY